MSGVSEELRDRTKRYASSIIQLYVKIPKSAEAQVLGRQLFRSRTSVAANFRDASRARSTSEFISKIEVRIQEADESDLCLELLRDDCGILDGVAPLLVETNELISIFLTMAKRSKDSMPS
jgi:four helix bundle protein